ncbi:MAG TPA: F0F1 ATP synthase subunit A [Planctomycetota bacterium]|nr:F0F1 ATP synthase subunit A [Planctomycetota bacterium]
MPEEAEKPEEHRPEHEGAEHEGGEHAASSDPMHHILDKVLVGVDKTTGGVVYLPLGEHGHPREIGTGVVYEPKKVGPFKLEFTKHMLDITVIAALFLALAMVVANRIKAGIAGGTAPKGKLANAFEAVVVYIRDEIVVPVGGHHLGHYTPLFITYFFFILIANLLGMIPEFGGATGNVGITLGLAGSVYLLIWVLGMINQGPVNYIKHLVPPGTPWWMWPGMFILELVSPLIKSFVLSVRLFANMIAGHLIVSNVLSLGAIGGLMPTGIAAIMLIFGIPLALGISILEILVCFIQAYVFTLLAVIFIGAAVHPEH